MAEPKNTQYPIPLSGQLLNTSSYEWDTKQFIGFNDLKGSYFQGCLSPFYRRVDTNSLFNSSRSFLGPDNRIWAIRGKDIYQDSTNNEPSYSFPETCNFSLRKKAETNNENLIAKTPLCDIFYNQNGDLYVLQNGTEVLRINVQNLIPTVHFDVIYLDSGEIKECIIIGDRVILYGVGNQISVLANFESNDDVTFQFIKYLDGAILFNTKEGMKYISAFLGSDQPIHTNINDRVEKVVDGLRTGGYSDVIDNIAIIGDNAFFYKDAEIGYVKVNEMTYTFPYRWSGLKMTGSILTANKVYEIHKSVPFVELQTGKVWYKVKDLLRTERQVMSTVEISATIVDFYTYHLEKVVSFDTEHNGYQDTFIKSDGSVSGNQVINVKRNGSFNLRIIGVGNTVSNISCMQDEQSQGTIIEPWFTIDNSKPIYIDDKYFIYSTTDGITYKVDKHTSITSKTYLNRYMVRNNAYGINCFDTKTKKFLLLGTDVGNSFIKGYNDDSTPLFDIQEKVDEDKYYKPKYGNVRWAALAVNEQYPISGISVSSSIFNSVPCIGNFETSNLLGTKIDSSEPDTWANFYLTSDDNLSSTPEYNCSFNFKKFNNIELAGTTFPNNDNVLLSICPSTNIEDTYLLYNNIKLNNKLSAQLATFEGENLLNYFLASVSYNVQEVFTIAGNIYSIKNNIIFQSSVNNGIVSSISPIINIGNMSLIGTLPLAALFYSDTNKKLYAFTGDANLMEFIDLTRYGKPFSVKANATSQDIVLIYRKEALIINNNGIWELPFYGFELPDDVFFSDNEIIFRKVWALFRYSYYKINKNYSVVPLKLATCFYGLQNNIVSTNDCIYIRLYNPNDEDGYLKMKATTLMNGVKETSLKEIALTKEMFDEQSKTYYHRFQPELQKATSESLEIETTFSVGTIIFSNQPETALIASQGSKGMKGHNF